MEKVCIRNFTIFLFFKGFNEIFSLFYEFVLSAPHTYILESSMNFSPKLFSVFLRILTNFPPNHI